MICYKCTLIFTKNDSYESHRRSHEETTTNLKRLSFKTNNSEIIKRKKKEEKDSDSKSNIIH